MSARKPAPDWEQAENLYRAGHLSLAEIGARVGVSKVAVKLHMDKAGIKRDLSVAVRQETKRKLAEQAVNDSINGKHGKKKKALTEQEIVEAGALEGVTVIRHHRRDIQAARELAAMLMGQLFQATEHFDLVEEAIDEETKDDGHRQRRALMLKAVSLPARAGVIRDLTTSMKNLQGLERQAFGLKDDFTGEDEPSKNLNLAVTFVKPANG